MPCARSIVPRSSAHWLGKANLTKAPRSATPFISLSAWTRRVCSRGEKIELLITFAIAGGDSAMSMKNDNGVSIVILKNEGQESGTQFNIGPAGMKITMKQ
jgi:hypothetical protein